MFSTPFSIFGCELLYIQLASVSRGSGQLLAVLLLKLYKDKVMDASIVMVSAQIPLSSTRFYPDIDVIFFGIETHELLAAEGPYS